MKHVLKFVAIAMVACGCNKTPFDHRAKYVGTYDFACSMNMYYTVTGESFDTAYQYTGKVTYGAGSDVLSIPFPPFGHDLEVEVLEDGTLKGSVNNNGSGEFATTNNLSFSWGSHSPGSSANWKLSGARK